MGRMLLAACASLLALGLAAAPASAREASGEAPADLAWMAAASSAAVDPLLSLAPSDAQAFCPGYDGQTPDQRRAFWGAFLLDLARSESRLNAGLSTWHAFDADAGRPTFRRGLLQVSIESARKPEYGCDAADPDDLLKVEPNLTCGVRILAARIKADGVIAGSGAKAGREGAARYWPSLADAKRRQAIAEDTLSLPACQAAAR